MAQTRSLVLARLPDCLASLVINYFGRSKDTYAMATLGQYEDCTKGEIINSALYGACGSGHLEIVKFIVDLNVGQLNTALAQAAAFDQLDIVKFLIEKGANDLNYALLSAHANRARAVSQFLIDYQK